MAFTQLKSEASGTAVAGVGLYPIDKVIAATYDGASYDGYVTFDPVNLPSIVTSATFSISVDKDQQIPFAQTISLHDDTSAGVVANGAGPGLYDDLATGDIYGTGSVSPTDFNTIYTFQLTQAAIDDLNAAIINNTKFSIGIYNESAVTYGQSLLLFDGINNEPFFAALQVNTVDPGPTQFADNLLGTDSGNVISALQGFDTVTALAGNDTVYGNEGSDVLYGNQGVDSLYGGKDNDIVFGGQDGDYIEGNFGSDVLYGNFGSDTIFGGLNDDVIFGGRDNDFLNGGQGNDLLVGGLGADRFFFATGQGNDTVTGIDADDVFDLQGQAVTDSTTLGQGIVIVQLSGGGSITLTGLSGQGLEGVHFA